MSKLLEINIAGQGNVCVKMSIYFYIADSGIPWMFPSLVYQTTPSPALDVPNSSKEKT